MRADCAAPASVYKQSNQGKDRSTAQHSSAQDKTAQKAEAVQFAVCNFRARLPADLPMGWLAQTQPAPGGCRVPNPGVMFRKCTSVAFSRIESYSALFNSVHREDAMLATPRREQVPCRTPRLGLLPRPWRSALVSNLTRHAFGRIRPTQREASSQKYAGAKRVEKQILRDPSLLLLRGAAVAYEVTAILALPAWHTAHSRLPIRCSRHGAHIISSACAPPPLEIISCFLS